VTSPATDGQENQSLAAAYASADISIIAYDLLCDVLSMY
jgi:hypothetical protein